MKIDLEQTPPEAKITSFYIWKYWMKNNNFKIKNNEKDERMRNNDNVVPSK